MPMTREQLAQRSLEIVETKEATAVCPGIMATGQILRNSTFEDTGTRAFAFLGPEGKTSDPILDD